VNAQLTHTFADWRDVARVAERQPIDPGRDLRLRPYVGLARAAIPQTPQSGELRS
jgi:hypothetical protein